MDEALAELVRISNTVGEDRTLVLGRFGNTSVKTADGKYMYIKASGTSLKDMDYKHGWRRVKVESVRSMFNDKKLANLGINEREFEIVNRLLLSCDDDVASGARPSVESPLHAVLDKCVIHLHALAVLAYVSCKNGKAELFNLFGDEKFPPVWVPYANPGYSLGRRVFRLTRRYLKEYGRRPSIMFIEKHGLLVSADGADDALGLVREVIARCNAGLEVPKAGGVKKVEQQQVNSLKRTIEKALFEVAGQKVTVRYFNNEVVSSFLVRKDAKKLLKAPPLTPDEMGFVNSPIIWLEKCDYKNVADKISRGISKRQTPPAAFLVKDVGLFIAGDDKIADITRNLVVGSLFVRSNAQDMGGINALNKRQHDFINNWEAEDFRIELARRRGAKT